MEELPRTPLSEREKKGMEEDYESRSPKRQKVSGNHDEANKENLSENADPFVIPEDEPQDRFLPRTIGSNFTFAKRERQQHMYLPIPTLEYQLLKVSQEAAVHDLERPRPGEKKKQVATKTVIPAAKISFPPKLSTNTSITDPPKTKEVSPVANKSTPPRKSTGYVPLQKAKKGPARNLTLDSPPPKKAAKKPAELTPAKKTVETPKSTPNKESTPKRPTEKVSKGAAIPKNVNLKESRRSVIETYLNSLPEGWYVELVERISGATKGHVDVYYISPGGNKCRSKGEVEDLLSKGVTPSAKRKRRQAEMEDGGSDEKGTEADRVERSHFFESPASQQKKTPSLSRSAKRTRTS